MKCKRPTVRLALLWVKPSKPSKACVRRSEILALRLLNCLPTEVLVAPISSFKSL
ncbi:hypothetical protein D3C72_2184730 [compost metagenome]